jgi:hypothetical protein
MTYTLQLNHLEPLVLMKQLFGHFQHVLGVKNDNNNLETISQRKFGINLHTNSVS